MKKQNSKYKKSVLFLLIYFPLHLSSEAHAVSLIASVPNAQTTPKGVFMIAHESQVPYFPDPGKANWQTFNFFTYGISEQFEVASTVYNLTFPGSGRLAASIGYKWVAPLSEQLKFIFGQEFPFALQGNVSVGHWTFTGLSYNFYQTNTRLTAGINSGSSLIFGSNVLDGFFGFEQSIVPHWTLIADWYSGKHDLGVLITAIQWNPNHSLTVITGPKWGNPGSFNENGWMLEITYEFM
ncbi:MAG: hypothetical protein KA715_11675 [Xanthomonadaceae bacterium]|nr:hypothetical protein [Xanthomonadaceae bacterium]